MCPILCNPMDCSLPGSSGYGISQARILEWFAIFFSRGIFLTQGLNTHLLHWQVDSLLLSHQGSPILPGSLVLSFPQSNCILLGQLYHQLSPVEPQLLFIFHFLRLSFDFLVSYHSLQTHPIWPGGQSLPAGNVNWLWGTDWAKVKRWGWAVASGRGCWSRGLLPGKAQSYGWKSRQRIDYQGPCMSIWGVWLIM